MGGYGLLSMAERAEIVGGRLHIRSRPDAGTTVTATIPLPAVPPPAPPADEAPAKNSSSVDLLKSTALR